MHVDELSCGNHMNYISHCMPSRVLRPIIICILGDDNLTLPIFILSEVKRVCKKFTYRSGLLRLRITALRELG